ncbi:hypothetical protein [Aquimonas sp.]|jgi:hypothetical protein|uniref:hypothetical protein n=1 Tax=Aquimonas sp. TaxID=1872588 RepID=UPI0037BEFB58
MNIVTKLWPSPAERAILYQILLVAVLHGGLYLTGLIDDGASRIGALCIWIFATSAQWLLYEGEEVEGLSRPSNVVPIVEKSRMQDDSSYLPRARTGREGQADIHTGSAMSESSVQLHPCPLCGASQGYDLKAGDTFRWFDVMCTCCHAIVAEARRGDHPADARNPAADVVWNEAGAYAASLAAECARLRAERRGDGCADFERLMICVELLREVYADGLKTNVRDWQERTNAALDAVLSSEPTGERLQQLDAT